MKKANMKKRQEGIPKYRKSLDARRDAVRYLMRKAKEMSMRLVSSSSEEKMVQLFDTEGEGRVDEVYSRGVISNRETLKEAAKAVLTTAGDSLIVSGSEEPLTGERVRKDVCDEEKVSEKGMSKREEVSTGGDESKSQGRSRGRRRSRHVREKHDMLNEKESHSEEGLGSAGKGIKEGHMSIEKSYDVSELGLETGV